MKIKFIQDNLLQALQRVVYITDKNTTLPILRNVLLRVKDGGVTLITTNLEVSITNIVRGKVEEEGEITIPGRLFHETIQLVPDEQVDVATEGQKVTVMGKNFHTTILGMNADDFPILPELPKGIVVKVPAKKLRDAISAVIFAVAPDETRPEISGVFFRADKGKLTLVATDSYRLAEKHIILDEAPKEKAQCIIPARSVAELGRIIGDSAGVVTLVFGENQVIAETSDFTFTTRLIEGSYPDYEQIIPPTHKTRATLSTAELLKAIKGASLFAPSGVNDIHLQFHPSKREVEVSASSGQLGENRVVVSGEVIGDENEIVFNWRYLMEGVDRAKTKQVFFDIVNPTNPGVLRPKDETDYTYLIMPIKQ